MDSTQLFNQIREKQSYLCVGLDTDYNQIPKFILEEEYPVFEFNKRIIDATADIAVAYKPNIAFYESMGTAGWMSLELTIQYLKLNHPNLFLIADGKRGDIGNTSKLYASAFYNHMQFDALTINPYMGKDSILPFLQYAKKWVIVLGLTSNDGAEDFQMLNLASSKSYLYEEIIRKSAEWGNTDNMMFVVGATQSDYLKKIRKIVPEHFLLIPGIGAQGGSLKDVSLKAMNSKCGILVNSSRSILYADGTRDFEKAAREKALEIQNEMAVYLKKKNLI